MRVVLLLSWSHFRRPAWWQIERTKEVVVEVEKVVYKEEPKGTLEKAVLVVQVCVCVSGPCNSSTRTTHAT